MSITPGKCTASCKETRSIRNPFKSIHAAALINMGEAVGGFAVLTALEQNSPKTKGIPTKLEGEFRKKARGSIVATCDVSSSLGDSKSINSIKNPLVVTSELRDESGDVVAVVKAYWTIKEETKKVK